MPFLGFLSFECRLALVSPGSDRQSCAVRAFAQVTQRLLVITPFWLVSSRHSLAVANASNAIMTKAGMRFCEACPHPKLGSTWRYEIAAGDAAG